MNERKTIVSSDESQEKNPAILNEQEVQGQLTSITRHILVADDIAHSARISQKLFINKNDRLQGIRFSMRSLSGPLAMRPIINTSSDSFVYQDNIDLEPSRWNDIVLTFQNFTDTGSQMHLDIDSFFPGDYESVNLLLIPMEDSKTDHVIEWGPVEALYNDLRYRFH